MTSDRQGEVSSCVFAPPVPLNLACIPVKCSAPKHRGAYAAPPAALGITGGSERQQWELRSKIIASVQGIIKKEFISNLEKVTRKKTEECRQRWEAKARYADFLLKNLAKGNCSCDSMLSCRAPCCRILEMLKCRWPQRMSEPLLWKGCAAGYEVQRPASNSQSPWSPGLLEDTLGDLPIGWAGAKALF